MVKARQTPEVYPFSLLRMVHDQSTQKVPAILRRSQQSLSMRTLTKILPKPPGNLMNEASTATPTPPPNSQEKEQADDITITHTPFIVNLEPRQKAPRTMELEGDDDEIQEIPVSPKKFELIDLDDTIDEGDRVGKQATSPVEQSVGIFPEIEEEELLELECREEGLSEAQADHDITKKSSWVKTKDILGKWTSARVAQKRIVKGTGAQGRPTAVLGARNVQIPMQTLRAVGPAGIPRQQMPIVSQTGAATRPSFILRQTRPTQAGAVVTMVSSSGPYNAIPFTAAANMPGQRISLPLIYDPTSGLILMNNPDNMSGGTMLNQAQVPRPSTPSILRATPNMTVRYAARPQNQISPRGFSPLPFNARTPSTLTRTPIPTSNTIRSGFLPTRANGPAGQIRLTTAPTPSVVGSLSAPGIAPSSRPPPQVIRPNIPQAPARVPISPAIPRAPQPNVVMASMIMPSGLARVEQTVTTPGLKGQDGEEKEGDASKTFPSLVVNVRTVLEKRKNEAVGRSELDAKVKSLLLHTPQKFSEWLLQRGLIRLDQICNDHFNPDRTPVSFKLGMATDEEAKKDSHTGGFVWVSDCCPGRQISIFNGSIFEGSTYPPTIILKLMYHWACQTSAVNVVQWVKVTSFFLKNFYALLRSVCISALHELSPPMGGKGVGVEVGILTLGTSAANTTVGKTKIEILGALDITKKSIRLKVINPSPGEMSATRLSQIISSLKRWVNKESKLYLDSAIDKKLVMESGFHTVEVSGAGSGNMNIMNYLKTVLPKMFQSTLYALSRPLIQQFLDELSWRELYGQSAVHTFDTLLDHIALVTKWELGEKLVDRLNKICITPSNEWSFTRDLGQLGMDSLPDSITGPSLAEYLGPRPSSPPKIPGSSSNEVGRKRAQEEADYEVNFLAHYSITPPTMFLDTYYYCSFSTKNPPVHRSDFPTNLKCPLCSKNILAANEVLPHILAHVKSLGRMSTIKDVCDCCLKDFQSPGALATHISEVHSLASAKIVCRICSVAFPSEKKLILHMWETHEEREAPYKCEVCDFRTSFHQHGVEHYKKEHSGIDGVLCPICFKFLTVKTVNCLTILVSHFQVHLIKKGKTCKRCALSFLTDSELKSHQEDHRRVVSGKMFIPKEGDQRVFMALPPEKPGESPTPPTKKPKTSTVLATPMMSTISRAGVDLYSIVKEDVRISMAPGVRCFECGLDVQKEGHFPGILTCISCRFITSCKRTMVSHQMQFHPLRGEKKKFVAAPREPPRNKGLWRCKCKTFKTRDTNALAAHLVNCHEPTAIRLKK